MEGARWMDIRSDRQKGLSYAEISRKYHIDPEQQKSMPIVKHVRYIS